MLAELPALGDEQHLAGTALFGADRGEAADAFGGFTEAQRFGDLAAAAGPHAPAVGDGRQEVAVQRVAVSAQFTLCGPGEEVEPVPERGKRIAGLGGGIGQVQHR